MNAQKLTQKSMEAIAKAQNIAIENQNIEIMPEHLLYALLDDDNGLIPSLVKKCNVDNDRLIAVIDEKIRKSPKVTGAGREPGKIYVAPITDKILNHAEKLAKEAKDEYISVEHIMQAIFEKSEDMATLMKSQGLTKAKFLEQLSAVKKNARVTSDNPETTYDALHKYGIDLVETARQHKLDPVIGRDSEIRDVIRILPEKLRTTPFLSANPVWARRLSPKGLL